MTCDTTKARPLNGLYVGIAAFCGIPGMPNICCKAVAATCWTSNLRVCPSVVYEVVDKLLDMPV
eukprot:12933572-Prorocentrum_lima.AAC.1